MALDLNELEEEEREDWRTSSLVARAALRMSKRRSDRGGAAAAGLAEKSTPLQAGGRATCAAGSCTL